MSIHIYLQAWYGSGDYVGVCAEGRREIWHLCCSFTAPPAALQGGNLAEDRTGVLFDCMLADPLWLCHLITILSAKAWSKLNLKSRKWLWLMEEFAVKWKEMNNWEYAPLLFSLKCSQSHLTGTAVKTLISVICVILHYNCHELTFTVNNF